MKDIQVTSKITCELIDSRASDEMVAMAAKVLAPGTDLPEGGEKIIPYMMKHRHGTPFEHTMFQFFVEAPIFVFREWHRHRIGFSYNETSARYKPMEPKFWQPSKERPLVAAPGSSSARPEFIPGGDAMWDKACESMAASYHEAWHTYQRLLDDGVAKEVARAVLPVGIFSSMWVTCNARSLMAFLSLRTHHKDASFVSYPQAEIEECAKKMEAEFARMMPVSYEAFVANGRVAP